MRFLLLLLPFLLNFCTLPTSRQAGLRFSTERSPIPDSLVWREIGFAKELINQKDKLVVISGGDRPIPLEDWDAFRPSFPWKKNIARNLLFNRTAFFRSPNTSRDCQGKDCIRQVEYQAYTWIALAEPVSVDFIPKKTDIFKPEKGHVVIKTIKKCQAVYFEGEIYELTDNQGNYYVMHAYETHAPDTTAVLPPGWTLKKKVLDEPLIVSPFGGGDDCYFNILGDHLGQGYHQYKFADAFYPPAQ